MAHFILETEMSGQKAYAAELENAGGVTVVTIYRDDAAVFNSVPAASKFRDKYNFVEEIRNANIVQID